MFAVHITSRAKALLDRQFSASALARPGLLVHRAIPAGGPIRLVDAKPPFGCQIASFESYPDAELLLVEGVLVYLALLPRRHEKGIRIDTENGVICVEETR